RAIHALWEGNFRKTGEQKALVLLRELKGEQAVLNVESRHVMGAASRHGENGYLVAYNDGPGAEEVEVKFRGATLRDGLLLGYDPGANVFLTRKQLTTSGDGVLRFSLGPLEAVGVRFRVQQEPAGLRKENITYAHEGKK